MLASGFRPDGHSLTILLKGCSDNGLEVGVGKRAHACILRNGLELDPFLVTALIDMYAKCGDVAAAFDVFDGSIGKCVPIWNAMIAGFYRVGEWERSLELFVQMTFEGFAVESATVSSVLMACSVGDAAAFGRGVHCCVVKMGFELHPYVSTSLVVMYGKFGAVGDARRVFYCVPDKRIELWNAMTSVCIGNGFLDEALYVYNRMRLSSMQPDSFTVSNMLSACSTAGLWDVGRSIHGELIKRPKLVNKAVQSSLITMYMKCGSIDNAISLFPSTKDRDLVTWGSMIVGFCQNQNFNEALGLFSRLRAEGLFLPDETIIASVASACTCLECLELGCQIHGLAVKSGAFSDQFVGSAFIDMYSKLGLPQLAGSIFSLLPCKNLVVLNTMISGYGRNGLLHESIGAFSEISELGLLPDSISVTSVLASVSSFAALEKGKMIHGYQVRNGIICDILVENALIDMYMKCGCLSYAQFIFERMPIRNVVSWNTVIAGYGSHGHCMKAIALFEEMGRSEILPDDTTFLSLLSSCSHSGLVEEGQKIFESVRRYSIVPRMEHYANMVDLLTRAGRLNEAYSFIHDMPVEPDERVWVCLLSACRAYRCSDLGEIAADQLLKLKPRESGSYTQVLNFYGEIGLLEKVAMVRMEMKKVGMTKHPGCSWIEVKDRVEVFYSGDSSSVLTVDIHFMLKGLRKTMTEVDEHRFDA